MHRRRAQIGGEDEDGEEEETDQPCRQRGVYHGGGGEGGSGERLPSPRSLALDLSFGGQCSSPRTSFSEPVQGHSASETRLMRFRIEN